MLRHTEEGLKVLLSYCFSISRINQEVENSNNAEVLTADIESSPSSLPSCLSPHPIDSLAHSLLIIFHIFGEGVWKSNINTDLKRRINVITGQALINLQVIYTY